MSTRSPRARSECAGLRSHVQVPLPRNTFLGVDEMKRMRIGGLLAFSLSLQSQLDLESCTAERAMPGKPSQRNSNFRYYSPVKRTALLTLLLIGLLSGLIGCYSGGHPARIGSNAPDFTLQDSDHKITLSQFRGQVVVLNFWGSFCPPCIEETPSMVRMQARLKDKGVVVLGISIDVDDAAYHKFLKDFNVNMVTVRDGAQRVSGLYGTFGWPETYVIDRNGVIRRKFIGAVDWTSPEITDYLSRL